MSQYCVNFNIIAIQILSGLLLLCMSSKFHCAIATPPGNETDLQALLDFKSLITEDPFKIMSLWNNSVHHCKWEGITCSNTGRVVQLNLVDQKLTGSIPPSIGNLTFLRKLNLSNNGFIGEFPYEVGQLLYLQHLNISYNYFGGSIPSNLSHCKDLSVLIADHNNFTGKIPIWIGNFSSLSIISLALNSLHGSIPNEVGQLSRLRFLGLNGNYLSSTVPSSIYNISSIFYFSIAQNHLWGSLPPDVGFTLPNLRIFAGGVNNFTGTVPASLLNASRLEILDFAVNALTGKLPKNIGILQHLTWLNFEDNRLGTREADGFSFLDSLSNCTSLKVFSVARNFYGGQLPSSIANLSSQLRRFTVGQNALYGSIPVGIGKLANLGILGFEGNHLSGSVPDDIGKLQNLDGLYLSNNNFSGTIPSSLGNLTSLTRLFMGDNNFEGSIPSSLGKCQKLRALSLSNNKLNGTIPKQVIGISSLALHLDISNNVLTGSLPDEVGNLDNLAALILSENKLSGIIPPSIGKCISLEKLYLQGNLFEGEIPQSLERLRGLEDIDLSRNKLSGKIPKFLSEFTGLEHVNLSYNDLEGEIPKAGIFKNVSSSSIYGNSKLCGGVPEFNLPACTTNKASSSSRKLLKMVIPLASTLVLVILLSCFLAYFLMVKKARKKSTARAITTEDLKSEFSYSELARCTSGFSQYNLIGSGSFGWVYKGTLAGERAFVAVKVLNLQQRGASRSFIDECNALRSIRHRNLLKIITVVSSVDHQGNDFKALVFEFMSNGNLDDWIHPSDNLHHQSKRLTFIQRLNIAIDVACALEYLHHFCQTPIVHCDIKPSNILLDNDLVAHVGDFGLATLLYEESSMSSTSKQLTISGALQGSIGYIPPEHGMGGQPSTVGDIYSYGILLLEIFTGKRPTSEEFQDGMGIHQFSALALPNHAMDVVDPSLPSGEEFEDKDEEIYSEEKAITKGKRSETNGRRRILEDCLASLIQIGVSCSADSPMQRLPMTLVVNELKAIKNIYIRK